ncbi:MAG: hypothetical protein IKE70_06020 [Bacilli bacterium]|nr:hypothetical protein [Bacilli bacterium]
MANKRNQGKREKDKKEAVTSSEMSFRGKVFVVLGVLVFFLVFYGVTFLLTKNDSEKTEEEDSSVQISYDEILLGRSLSMENDPYYVIFYDSKDETISGDFSSLVSNYRNKEGSINLYFVDMSKSFNKKFATTEESNKNPEDTSVMKINGPTVIKVIEGHVSDYIEGKDAITTLLS